MLFLVILCRKTQVTHAPSVREEGKRADYSQMRGNCGAESCSEARCVSFLGGSSLWSSAPHEVAVDPFLHLCRFIVVLCSNHEHYKTVFHHISTFKGIHRVNGALCLNACASAEGTRKEWVINWQWCFLCKNTQVRKRSQSIRFLMSIQKYTYEWHKSQVRIFKTMTRLFVSIPHSISNELYVYVIKNVGFQL